jgi:hypothetical protein
MTNRRRTPDILVPLAFSAAISLLLGHLTYLAIGLLGAGSITTLSLIGSLAGVAACTVSLLVGFRRISKR